jgi:hypothetical protein
MKLSNLIKKITLTAKQTPNLLKTNKRQNLH